MNGDGAMVMNEKSCCTCANYLGGGCCKINVEDECAEGEFELWMTNDRTGKDMNVLSKERCASYEV